MFLHSVPPVLPLLVLPVPPREGPKGEEEGNIQSSGFSDSICSSICLGGRSKVVGRDGLPASPLRMYPRDNAVGVPDS